MMETSWSLKFQNEEGETTAVRVWLSEKDLCWSNLQDGILHTTRLAARQILAANIKYDDNTSTLVVYYVKYLVNNKENLELSKASVSFEGDNDSCTCICNSLKNLLEMEKQRPKRWLLFINPTSGWRKSKAKYAAIVQPLLELCSIDARVIETESEHHAPRILAMIDLSSIDAVVVMGGDGTIGQVTSALLKKTIADAGLDVNDRHINLPKCLVRVGAIPAGSVNVLAYCLTSNQSVEACTLAIILGHTTPVDGIVVYHGNVFTRQSNLDAMFGPAATTGVTIENLRWLRVLRIPLAIPLAWWYWKSADVEIEYLEVEPNKKLFSLGREANEANSYFDESTTVLPTKPRWKIFVGKLCFIQIISLKVMDVLHEWTKGCYLPPNMSNGRYMLTLYKDMPFSSFAAEMNTSRKRGRAYCRSSLMKQIEVTSCKIKLQSHLPGDITHKFTQDGDAVEVPAVPDEFYINSHTGCMDMFCVDPVIAQKQLGGIQDKNAYIT